MKRPKWSRGKPKGIPEPKKAEKAEFRGAEGWQTKVASVDGPKGTNENREYGSEEGR